ncbi:MAG: 30S ribosomal protein S4 [Chloroflexi bacterium]|nr:30S ribosomal protein S4 [Chloroflexota bacterium]
MARYTGPVCKLCRREGAKLLLKGERCFNAKCGMEPNKRPYPPGQHQQQRRRKVSEFGTQLREKQKAKHIYGLLERQFRKVFAVADRRSGATGENLLQLLETRLDNVVFRLGFADSRRQARQLVRHGHFAVNGRATDIPSFQVKPGDVIAVREGSRKLELLKDSVEAVGNKALPSWLSIDPASMSGRALAAPSRADIDASLNEQLIVEYYSR